MAKHTADGNGQPALHLDLTKKRPYQQRDQPIRKANIRVAETLDPTDERSALKHRSRLFMTGWDLYQLIPAPVVKARHGTSDRYTRELLGLYTAYSAPQGNEILDLVALQSASDKETSTKQPQVLVQWAGCTMPYETIQLAEQLGYQAAEMRPATPAVILQEGMDTM